MFLNIQGPEWLNDREEDNCLKKKIEIEMWLSEERGTKLSFGSATSGCKPNGFGSSLHLFEASKHTLRLSFCPHNPTCLCSSLPCLTYLIYPYKPIHSSHKINLPPSFSVTTTHFSLSSILNSETHKFREKWPSENQTGLHKQQFWSRFWSGAPAWEKSSNTMTNRDTLWTFQRGILWFMLEKTEPGT